MTRIAWLSRHKPTPKQRSELERLFPKHQLVIDPKPFSSASDIVRRMRESHASELVAVAPLHVIKELLALGVKPITAHMQLVKCDSPQAEVRVSGRCYSFTGFERVEAINIQTKPM